MTAQADTAATSFERVINALERVEARPIVRGTHCQALCPAHDDAAPSLSVDHRPGAAKPGTMVHCHGGCDTDDVLAMLGLRPTDLYDTPPARPAGGTTAPARPARAGRGGRAVAAAPAAPRGPECESKGGQHTYARFGPGPDRPGPGQTWSAYTSADGTPVGWKIRRTCLHPGCAGRTFGWARPLPSGQLDYHAPDNPPLYRLPELAAALAAGAPVHVYICEGESDTDAARAAGATAVTSGNWGSWRARHTDQLAGVTGATICADRDEKAGAAFARNVRGQLEAAGIPARVVQALTGKDVRDHLTAGHTLAQLVDITGQLDTPGPDQTEPEEPMTGTATTEGRPGDQEDQASGKPLASVTPIRDGQDAGAGTARPGPLLFMVNRDEFCIADGSTRNSDGRIYPRGIYTLRKGDRWWTLIAPLPYVRALIIRRDAGGKVKSHEYLLSATPDSSPILAGNIALRFGTWAQQLDLPLSDDKTIVTVASTAIRREAAAAPKRENAARWEGDRLDIPPTEALPPGYLETSGSEEAARAGWAEIGKLACSEGAENLALNLGAAYAAPYPAALSKVRPVSFALVGIGEPRKGKTTNVNAAAGWWGAPVKLNPAMSESAIAMGDILTNLGCLPVFRDEVDSAAWTETQYSQFFHRSLNGAARRRSSSDGSGAVTSTAPWWGIQFLSGNRDPRFGATDGVQARLAVMSDPHLPDAETSDRVTYLLGEHYGWPIHWQLGQLATPSAIAGMAERARADLTTADLDGSAQTVAKSLALAVAGAEAAGGLIGAPGLRDAALTAARRVLSTLVDTLADQPVSFGDQLLETVLADVQSHPRPYPGRAGFEGMRGDVDPPRGTYAATAAQDVFGFLHDHDGAPVVSVTRQHFEQLTTGVAYGVREALGQLRDRGLLVAKGDRRGFQHLIQFGPDWSDRFYTFKRSVTTPEGARNDTRNDAPEHPNVPLTCDVTTLTTLTTPFALHPHMHEGGEAGGGAEGTCSVCQERLTVVEAGQTTHPDCDPDPPCPGCGERVPTAWVRVAYEGWHPVHAPADIRARGDAARASREAAQQAQTGQGAPEPGQVVAPATQVAAPATQAPPGPENGAQGRTAGSDQGVAARWRPFESREAEDQAWRTAALKLDEEPPTLKLGDLLLRSTSMRSRSCDDGKGMNRRPMWIPDWSEVGMAKAVTVVEGYGAWSRPYEGPATTLDANGAWVAAAGVAHVAHCALRRRTGPNITVESTEAGYVLVDVFAWHETDMPSPLARDLKVGTTVWVPLPTYWLLKDLAEEDRWPEVKVLDSWLSHGIRLGGRPGASGWADRASGLRKQILEKYGRESPQYSDVFKHAFGSVISVMVTETGMPVNRQDWAHAFKAMGAANIWRKADKIRKALPPGQGPIMLRNIDEIVVPTEAMDIIRQSPDLTVKIDDGIELGQFKVKGEEEWGQS